MKEKIFMNNLDLYFKKYNKSTTIFKYPLYNSLLLLCNEYCNKPNNIPIK